MTKERRIDLIEAAARVLAEAGMPGATGSLSEAAMAPEATVITTGVPTRGRRYWDGTGTTVVRLTVLVKRLSEERALADAAEASRAMRREGALASANGSYVLVSCEADMPRLLAWDGRGGITYVLDVSVEYEEA